MHKIPIKKYYLRKMSDKNIFIAVFLYSTSPISDSNEKERYEKIQKIIESTSFLNKYLRKICIDNDYSRNLLRKHKIKKWPIFVINENYKVTVYNLKDVNIVFEKVYFQYKKFYSSRLDSNIESCPKIN